MGPMCASQRRQRLVETHRSILIMLCEIFITCAHYLYVMKCTFGQRERFLHTDTQGFSSGYRWHSSEQTETLRSSYSCRMLSPSVFKPWPGFHEHINERNSPFYQSYLVWPTEEGVNGLITPECERNLAAGAGALQMPPGCWERRSRGEGST